LPTLYERGDLASRPTCRRRRSCRFGGGARNGALWRRFDAFWTAML